MFVSLSRCCLINSRRQKEMIKHQTFNAWVVVVDNEQLLSRILNIPCIYIGLYILYIKTMSFNHMIPIPGTGTS